MSATRSVPAPVNTATPNVPPGSASAYIEIAWFLGLLCLVFAPVLLGMFKEWMHDDDMGHGLFVPIVAAWIIWQKREELARQPISSCKWGIPLLILGGIQLIAATLGVELFLARTALLISLAGLILTVWGISVFRTLAFPLFLLVFMIRIPAIIYNQITFPLQLLASSVAEAALNLIGIPVLREGNVLELPSQKLSVVEACSGIRSLLSLTFLSLVYGYFFENKRWTRILLFLATIPIAIAANAFRVTTTGILSEYKRDLAEGFFHSMEGWLIFIVALAILVVFHTAVNRVHGAYKAAHVTD